MDKRYAFHRTSWLLLLLPVSAICYLNLPLIREWHVLADPVTLTFVASATLFCVWLQRRALTTFELFLLSFIGYVIIRTLLAGAVDYTAIARLVLFFVLVMAAVTLPPLTEQAQFSLGFSGKLDTLNQAKLYKIRYVFNEEVLSASNTKIPAHELLFELQEYLRAGQSSLLALFERCRKAYDHQTDL